MRATVCELPATAGEDALEETWEGLATHAREAGSELVLLPEMPFVRWLPAGPEPDDRAWRDAAEAHDRWIGRLEELGVELVAGSRPVLEAGRRFNEGFVWSAESGYRAVRRKRHLPDEPGFWEASWYEPGPDEPFRPVELPGGLRVGFLICTDLWFGRHARELGDAGAHLILCPRATPLETREKWLVGGRAAAVVSGAWCLSSNYSGSVPREDGAEAGASELRFGGSGWIIEPEAGEVAGTTADDAPFLTLEIDPAAADAAKETYPRYVR